jgi:hypothetical protein
LVALVQRGEGCCSGIYVVCGCLGRSDAFRMVLARETKGSCENWLAVVTMLCAVVGFTVLAF